MKAYFDRDSHGFWTAYIEDETTSPENRGIGTVRRRQTLPVPQSATRDEAAVAFRRLMSREARCRREHR